MQDDLGADVPADLAEVAAAVAAGRDHDRAALEELVRIPSVSAAGHDPAAVRESAEATASLLARSGFEDVRLLEVPGTHPSVHGARLDAGEAAPTVLLYAHHDVQPVPTPQRWRSEPFEPTERGGRLYGRGAADDKAGILVHVAAVRAWLEARGGVPLNVKVVVEGEEEIGSPHLGELLERYGDLLRADVIVLTDVSNWQVGWPGLTYALRGIALLDVRLEALEQPLHSGMWGGPVPDALTGMARLLASLHDDDGAPAVAGFLDDVREPTPEERARLEALADGTGAGELAREARLLDGVEWVGERDRGILERLWMRPTITPIGVDVPSVAEAAPQLLAEATARISLRLAPGQDAERAVAAHLEEHAPWGMRVRVEPGIAVPAWVTEPTGPAHEAARAAMAAAYGREPALMGCGATIPFVAPFSEAFDDAPCLLTGIEDPATNAHGEDESLHLGDFERACLAEALLLGYLAQRLS